MCGLSSSPACVHWGRARAALRRSAACSSTQRWPVPHRDAGSSLGAKWFLSLGKQRPSNLSPLRSIWIHFTLTRRKTGNFRQGSGQELSLQVKRATVLACVQCVIWVSVRRWTCSHSQILHGQSEVCRLYGVLMLCREFAPCFGTKDEQTNEDCSWGLGCSKKCIMQRFH